VSQESLTQMEPIGASRHRARRILIVDDDEGQVEVLATRFKRQGFQTVTATRGRDGIKRAREDGPHLVLLDLRLPDIDGMQVCRELTDDPATCSLPVIILSGMERPDIIRRSRAAGCLYFVRKPYDPNALLVLVERALDEAANW
jgi:CheY-like chemotaxis protein